MILEKSNFISFYLYHKDKDRKDFNFQDDKEIMKNYLIYQYNFYYDEDKDDEIFEIDRNEDFNYHNINYEILDYQYDDIQDLEEMKRIDKIFFKYLDYIKSKNLLK